MPPSAWTWEAQVVQVVSLMCSIVRNMLTDTTSLKRLPDKTGCSTTKWEWLVYPIQGYLSSTLALPIHRHLPRLLSIDLPMLGRCSGGWYLQQRLYQTMGQCSRVGLTGGWSQLGHRKNRERRYHLCGQPVSLEPQRWFWEFPSSHGHSSRCSRCERPNACWSLKLNHLCSTEVHFKMNKRELSLEQCSNPLTNLEC